MKALFKPLFSWILGLLNVSIYCSDDIDSLLHQLQLLGLQHQANEIVHLYQLLEQHQGTLVFLDALRTALMLLSLLFLFIINFHAFQKAWHWAKSKALNIALFFKHLKTSFKQWRM